MRARLLDMEQRKQQQELSSSRRSQVGTGDRSEKVRTYNFPQDRITDHRLSVTLHGLPQLLDGDLDHLLDLLDKNGQDQQLGDLLS